MFRILLIIPLLLVSACEDGAVGMRGSPAWKSTASESTQRSYYQAICLDKGYELGTTEMEVCVDGKPEDPNAPKRSSSGIIKCDKIGKTGVMCTEL